ncbi:SEC14-like protein 2 isoform X3 [Phycodurus eques]|uniref:SEC14-like protein 2 isoform X3 n=1 Tax=Phycodurus eques TaxID=693459 RepID=UPI002ACE4DC7|nr:SEC14-like protein 2 isoform X3 [Phycodurus eques]
MASEQTGRVAKPNDVLSLDCVCVCVCIEGVALPPPRPAIVPPACIVPSQAGSFSGNMSGRVADLSAKQADSLTQFRNRIADVLPELPAQHDHYLLRWLRARSFNVAKAEVMIRKHADFRRTMKVDGIISDWTPPEVIARYVSGGMCGHDKEGSPLWYDVVGPLDPKGLLMSASKQDFVRTKIRNMEMLQRECQKQSRKLGVNVESVTLIYDCEGLGFKHMWKPAIETYGEILTMFEDNYPEGLKRVFLIKAPKVFPVAYNLIKNFLCEETRRKLVVLGTGNWQEVLRTHVDAEQLPAAYGGTRTDPDGDPRCRTMINYGGTVPRSYYIQNSIEVQYDTIVTVSRGATLQLEYDVSDACSLLRWQFASDGADIGFGVYRRPPRGGGQKTAAMLQVVPTQRYNAHLVPEDNVITCPEAGMSTASCGPSASATRWRCFLRRRDDAAARQRFPTGPDGRATFGHQASARQRSSCHGECTLLGTHLTSVHNWST